MDEGNILIIIDPERADHPVLERGMELALRLDATLELYTCEVLQDVPARWAGALSAQQFSAMVREQRLQLLERLAQPLRSRGVQVRTRSDSCPSLERGILRHIVATKPSAVLEDEVYGMHERGSRSASNDEVADEPA